MSLKASSRIADRERRGSQYAPLLDTVCYSKSIRVVNFSGHPYFTSSCHSHVFTTVSNAFVKSTETMHFSKMLSQAEDHVHCSPVLMNDALRLWYHLWVHAA